jgi:hypothetical protein
MICLNACSLFHTATKNLTATLCHAPKRSRGKEVRISNIVVAVVAAACCLARLMYKASFSISDLGADDWAVLGAVVAGVPSVIMIDRGLVPNGLGVDAWLLPFDYITNFVRVLYVLEALYFLQIALIKLTLLLFFLRIFPKPLIRRLIWGTIAFDMACSVAFVITAIFQCQPISFYWTSWDKEGPGKCININGLAWANAIISVVMDLWMLALPLYEVFHLQLNWRKKISVALMFFVGTL